MTIDTVRLCTYLQWRLKVQCCTRVQDVQVGKILETHWEEETNLNLVLVLANRALLCLPVGRSPSSSDSGPVPDSDWIYKGPGWRTGKFMQSTWQSAPVLLGCQSIPDSDGMAASHEVQGCSITNSLEVRILLYPKLLLCCWARRLMISLVWPRAAV